VKMSVSVKMSVGMCDMGVVSSRSLPLGDVRCAGMCK